MKKNLLQRVIIIAVVTLLGLAAILWPGRTPNRGDFTLAGVNNILRRNINLGLDLRGGSHLVMQVQVQDYLRRLTENIYNGVQQAAREQGYDLKEARPEISGDSYRVVVVANDASKVSDIRDQLPRRVNDFNPSDWSSSARAGARRSRTSRSKASTTPCARTSGSGSTCAAARTSSCRSRSRTTSSG